MKEIRLENFRCYSNQTVRFKPNINLLIGDNASGKTSLLKACKYVLSAFFSGFSDENTRWISPDIDDFSIQIKDGVIAPELPVKIHFICDSAQYELLPSSNGELYNPSHNQQSYTLQKNSKKNSRALTSGIIEYRDYAKLLQSSYTNIGEAQTTRVYALPLFACFSTEDIHTTRKIDADKFLQYAQKASFGYYECLDGNGFFSYWQKRLLVLQEGKKNLQEIEIVRRSITKALGPEGCNIITDMQVRPIQGKVYYIFTDGREVESSLLSDGYKRLVNIVTDIAFRCALLNREMYGLEATERTRGTVLIDEIDLHLHPTLQATVLKGLKHAFPNLQFIATTHAPMIMTGVESNQENAVYKLDYSESEGYQVRETVTFGLDVSTITNAILKQTPRDESVDKELELLFHYIDEENYADARTKLSEMKEKFGDNLPELSKAEAIVSFMTDTDENEEDNKE